MEQPRLTPEEQELILYLRSLNVTPFIGSVVLHFDGNGIVKANENKTILFRKVESRANRRVMVRVSEEERS